MTSRKLWLHFDVDCTYNRYREQCMRSWTSKSDYTIVQYKGVVPRRVVATEDGIEIPPRPPNAEQWFPNRKEAGGLVPASKLIGEIQKAVQVHQRDFLPATAVIGMINMTVHASLTGRVDGVPADINNWPDPPHVEFANRAFESPEDVKQFVENYGLSPGMIYDPRLGYASPAAIRISVQRLQQEQDLLQQDWGKTELAQTLKDHFLWNANDIDFVNGKPQIIIRDILEYIMVLFLIDLSAGRLKVCKNPQCKRLKYFAQERRNQKFCSESCKNTWNINSWLADPENRKSWNAARRKATKVARGGKS